MRKIQIIPLVKQENLKKLLNEYLLELSEFDPDIKFDENNTPIYKWFECYFTDKDRYPIYLIVDDNIAGFALIREIKNMQYDFAEFYVIPNYRKDGNALWFANEITNIFDGEFTFSTRHSNPRGISFWSKFANQFNDSEFTDDDIWRNWVVRKNNFSTHTLNLQPIYFELIKNQIKTLEGRLNDEKRQKFNIGDTITFFKEPEKQETLKALILDKYIFTSFDQMSNSLNKKDLGFENTSKEEMVNVYRNIYSKEKEEKYGVVIFKIKTLNKE